MSDTAALAAKHLEIAVSLMGQEWVQERLTTQAQAQVQAKPSGRGRKAGAVPDQDHRCHWQPEGKEQCKNSRSDQNSYCKIHLNLVHLVDTA